MQKNHPSLCFRLHHPLPALCCHLVCLLQGQLLLDPGQLWMISCFQIKSHLQAPGARINLTYFSGTIVQPSMGRLPPEGHFENLESWMTWWGGGHMTEPRFLTTARAPQECCVLGRGQGEDECGGADGPDEAASERLNEGKAEEPAAPSQPCP